MMKKAVSVILTALMIQSICVTGTIMTSAAETKVNESTVQTQVSESNGDAVYGDFTYSTSDKKVKITKYTGSSETVVIPSKINEMPVTEIAFNTFADNHNIRRVTISEGVEQIWHYAFKNCVNLETVELPNSLIDIQQSAFLNCSRLKNIDIPDNVSFIGIGAFVDCKSLEKIEIPDGINDIMMATFSGCESLKRVTLSDSVKNIMEEAFKNCTALTNINIPNSVERISSYAFQNCKTLESIVIPESVVHIGRTPFDGCTALRDIYYTGTETQWNNILLGYEPNFEGITVHYNYKENSVCFDKSELVLGVGQTDTLSVKGKVSEILTWKSSNVTVATVNTNGKIIARNIGTADITVTTTYGEQAFCKVTVKQAPTKVTLNKSALIVGKGETFNFVGSVPNEQYQGTVTYTSSDRNVATVDGNGKMTAKATGTAILTVTTYNGKTAKCRVTVKNAPTSIFVNRKNSIMGLGETFYLEGSLANDEASRVMTFSSNKPEVATVTDGGIITAKSIGTAIVSITTYNGQKATCRVTVRNAPTSLQFNKTSVTLKQGETFYLESQFNTGEYARTVIYNSPNKTVATISGSGVIMAKSKGTVKITGKTYNGKTATCEVTVKKVPESIALNKTETIIKKGNTETLNAILSPEDCATYCSWSSSDKTIATVNSNGVVTAKKAGNVTITVKTSNGKVATCTVTVRDFTNLTSYQPLGSLSQGYICLSCDDGSTNLVTDTIPLLKSYKDEYNRNIPVTFGLMSSSQIFNTTDNRYKVLAEGDEVNKVEAVREMLKDYGCEVAIHGSKDYTTMETDELISFLQEQQEYLTTTLGVTPRSIIYPEHTYSIETTAICGNFFGVCATGGKMRPIKYDDYRGQSGEGSNLYTLYRKSLFNSEVNETKIKNWIDDCIVNHQVLLLFWHDNKFKKDYDRCKRLLNYCVSYAMQNNVEFCTLGDIPYL